METSMVSGDLVLVIETANKNSSISLMRDDAELGVKEFGEKEPVSEFLLQKISGLLLENNIKLPEVKLLIVSLGPGSMTGTRIGIAAAKGLAKSLGLKCIGVPVFDALNSYQESSGDLCSVVFTGRTSCYWQISIRQKSFDIKFGSFEELREDLLQYPDLTVLCDKYLQEKIKDIVRSDQVIIPVSFTKAVGLKRIQIMNSGNDLKKELAPVYISEKSFQK